VPSGYTRWGFGSPSTEPHGSTFRVAHDDDLLVRGPTVGRTGDGFSWPPRARSSFLWQVKPPTGEPDAGIPPVRFGGRGSLCRLSLPLSERRILAQLDQPPPAGRARWNGRLLAQALGDVSASQVWAVLRKHGVELERRHSWCVSTDPEFTRKAAEIVGLYLDPPAGAVVLSVDEKPAIQALERAQGWLRLPNGRSLRGFNHEYQRHGTTTLFAALEVFTGTVCTAHYPRRRRREFLDFMNPLVASYPGRELHVIVDNLSTHKPKHERWLGRHPNVHFHYTPTHASWLNQVECWFSILSRQALQGASFTSVGQLRQAIDRFVSQYNQTATPFEWTKRDVKPSQLKHRYANLLN